MTQGLVATYIQLKLPQKLIAKKMIADRPKLFLFILRNKGFKQIMIIPQVLAIMIQSGSIQKFLLLSFNPLPR